MDRMLQGIYVYFIDPSLNKILIDTGSWYYIARTYLFGIYSTHWRIEWYEKEPVISYIYIDFNVVKK